ncbi:unnamed protein product [Mesocestoides corti]|nr:unnamed protein product [Mesocestoides corti]
MPFSQLTEEQQINIAMRMGLIATLPVFIFDEIVHEKLTECVICMCDFVNGEELRSMPTCSHTFHRTCIDDWLSRSPTCPSCLQELRFPLQPPVPPSQPELPSDGDNVATTSGAAGRQPSPDDPRTLRQHQVKERAKPRSSASTLPS